MKHNFNLKYIFGISLVSALGGLLFGYDLVVIGGAKEFYELTFGLNSAALQGWAVSSCIVGCIIGAMGVGKPSDKYGRKKLLIISALLFFISALGSGYAPTFTQFVIYRLIGGVGMGMASTLSPMYIAEISPAKMRGRFVSLNQLTIVIGILLAQLINYMILQSNPIETEIELSRPIVHALAQKLENSPESIKLNQLLSDSQIKSIQSEEFLRRVSNREKMIKLLSAETISKQELLGPIKEMKQFYNLALSNSWNGQKGWRWMFAAEGLPALAFFLLMFLVPCSPRWLVKKGRDDEAESVLTKVGSADYAKSELLEIEKTLTSGHKEAKVTDLFKPHLRKVLLMGVIMAIYQQWCGINVIFNYANDIFRAAGYDVSGILFNLVIVGVTNMLFTFVAMGLIDKVGRKVLILWGSLGLAVCYTGVGLCFHFNITGVGVLILVLGAIACFAATLGPVMWVLISEIFPNRIRGLAMAISVFSLWVANFVLSYTFPILNEGLGASTTFWLYAAINVAGFFYILKAVPETKNKTLEEIECELIGDE